MHPESEGGPTCLCGRRFPKLFGLHVHQRTCPTAAQARDELAATAAARANVPLDWAGNK